MKKLVFITLLFLLLGISTFEFAFGGGLRFLSDIPILPSSTTRSVSIEDILTREQLVQYKEALRQQEAQKEADELMEAQKLQENEQEVASNEDAEPEGSSVDNNNGNFCDNFKHTVNIETSDSDEPE